MRKKIETCFFTVVLSILSVFVFSSCQNDSMAAEKQLQSMQEEINETYSEIPIGLYYKDGDKESSSVQVYEDHTISLNKFDMNELESILKYELDNNYIDRSELVNEFGKRGEFFVHGMDDGTIIISDYLFGKDKNRNCSLKIVFDPNTNTLTIFENQKYVLDDTEK